MRVPSSADRSKSCHFHKDVRFEVGHRLSDHRGSAGDRFGLLFTLVGRQLLSHCAARSREWLSLPRLVGYETPVRRGYSRTLVAGKGRLKLLNTTRYGLSVDTLQQRPRTAQASYYHTTMGPQFGPALDRAVQCSPLHSIRRRQHVHVHVEKKPAVPVA